ncbi:AAA family ATPase [Streptomyces sp. NPDC007984]|uniref:AAA family ATPase n=1 Tax=Streptomyces sp. NPDC007984 TaxID=3364801 RepID=UPI0036E32BE6
MIPFPTPFHNPVADEGNPYSAGPTRELLPWYDVAVNGLSDRELLVADSLSKLPSGEGHAPAMAALLGQVPQERHEAIVNASLALLCPEAESLAGARRMRVEWAREADPEAVRRAAVDARKEYLEVDEQAKEERRTEREAYLKSEQGQAEAAARFAVDVTDCPEDDWEQREPLIEGVLYRGTANRIVGPSGSLKSFAAIDIANHVQLGRPWYGRGVTQANTLYIAAEGALGIPGRKRAWEIYHNGGQPTGTAFRRVPVQLSDPEQVRDLIAWCKGAAIGLVVVDTQAKSTVGVNENDNSEMTVIMRTVDIIAEETGAAVLLIHHPAGDEAGKSGRGAKGVFGALDGEIHAERKGKDTPADSVTLTFPKLKDDATDGEIVMRVQPVEVNRAGHRSSLVLVDETAAAPGTFAQPVNSAERPDGYRDDHLPYLNVIKDWEPSGGILQSALIDELGKAKSTVSKVINNMSGAGLVEKSGSRWKITKKGREALRWAARQPVTKEPEAVQEALPGAVEPANLAANSGANGSPLGSPEVR